MHERVADHLQVAASRGSGCRRRTRWCRSRGPCRRAARRRARSTWNGCWLRARSCRRLRDRVDDRLVARAAADVAGERLGDLLARRRRVAVEQRAARSISIPGRAEAALDGEALVEDRAGAGPSPPSPRASAPTARRRSRPAAGTRAPARRRPSPCTTRSRPAGSRPWPRAAASCSRRTWLSVASGPAITSVGAPVELELEDLRRHGSPPVLGARTARSCACGTRRWRSRRSAGRPRRPPPRRRAGSSRCASAPADRTGCGATPPSATRPPATATHTTAGELAARRAQRSEHAVARLVVERDRADDLLAGRNSSQKSLERDRARPRAEPRRPSASSATATSPPTTQVAADRRHVAQRRPADRLAPRPRRRRRRAPRERRHRADRRRPPHRSTPSSPARARPTTRVASQRAGEDGGHHGRAAAHDHRVVASSATACSAEPGSRYSVDHSPPPSIRANMRPGDPSAPRIGTKPAKNGTRTPTGSCESPVSCWIRIAPRSRIALWTTKSSDVKSGSRARPLAEAVEADDLGALVDEPAGRLGLAVGRAHVVVGEAAPRLLGPVGPAQRDVTVRDRRRVLLEQRDRDRLVLAEEREVDDDRLPARAVERDVGGGLAVLRAVAPEVDVRAGVQQHVDLARLPEARAAVVRGELEPLVHRRRAQRVLADLQRQVDDPRHARCATFSR